MTRSEYMQQIEELYANGELDDDAMDAMVLAADKMHFDPEPDCRFPKGYTEIDYKDFDNPEAIDGAKFDDRNFLRYFER